MMSRKLRNLALASMLSTGLVAWSGCNNENPDGTPNKLGKVEAEIKKDAKIVEEKVKEGAEKAGAEIKKDAKIVADEVKKDAAIAGEKIKEGVDAAKDKMSELNKPAPAAPTPPVETPK